MTEFHRTLLVLGTLAVAAPTTSGAETIQLRRLASGAVAAPVQIAGHDLWLLVDTGSNRSLIRSAIATRIGLEPRSGYRLHTPTRVVDTSCAPATVLLGSKRLAINCIGWSREIDHLAGMHRADGILGTDALVREPVVIDFERGSLTLGPEGLPSGTPLPLEMIAGRPAIDLRLRVPGNQEGHSLRFVLDSGASTIVLFGSAARRQPVHRSAVARVDSLTGPRLVRRLPEATIGPGLTVDGPVLLPEVTDRQADGLLPLQVLPRVFFDWPRHRVVIDDASLAQGIAAEGQPRPPHPMRIGRRSSR